ncbi:MAG: ribosome small subunit-dependent GTPase A [Candidatus Gastranaerophilales bacterium]|nr:ribosome small subunit-dependent GTPase A [Candidatus Gastranaerophilales bacterium]
MIGSIVKIHSNFYYANVEGNIIECKIREKLKKEKAEIYVGDTALLEEINYESNQAVITEILPRKNFIPRPSIANIDQVIILAALDQPSLDLMQLDRYLASIRLYNIPAIICINKSDLDDVKGMKDQISSIYEPIGYKIIFTSVIKGLGIDELKDVFDSKISVLAGASGVGKSSLLNMLNPQLKLKTNPVSAKTSRGIHSTRHVELLEISLGNDKFAQIADTPGFSNLKFDNIMPDKVQELFVEIAELSPDCYYSDCLHLEDDGCNVLVNINKIALSRYESYKIFVKEAMEFKKKITFSGQKEEKRIKILDVKDKEKIRIVKLGTKTRETSRKNQKQKLSFISSLDDAYYNGDDE